MNKKKILLVIAIVAVIAVPFSVFAATSDSTTARGIRGFVGGEKPTRPVLTDAQKADVKVYSEKMAALQKEFINKMVENGAIKKEQADAAIAKIDERIKNGSEDGFMPIPGIGGPRGDFKAPADMKDKMDKFRNSPEMKDRMDKFKGSPEMKDKIEKFRGRGRAPGATESPNAPVQTPQTSQ